jgi:hypothetical protein
MNLESIFRSSYAIALSLALVAASPALADVVIAPGETVTDVVADASESMCDPANCEVMFDLESNTLFLVAKVAGVDEAAASATLLSSFVVTADGNEPSDQTPLLGSSRSVIVNARGTLTLDGVDSTAGYRLDLLVTDSADGTPIGAARVAEGVATGNTELVVVSEMEVLNLNLTRGHEYQVALTLSVFAASGQSETATADFGDSSASWEALTITAGADVLGSIGDLQDDVTELQDDVTELQVDVAELQVDVIQLQVDVVELRVDVDELAGDLGDLEEEFQNHTHDYLTGKGNGHNNTTATTTTPDEGASIDPRDDDGEEEVEEEAEESNPGNSGSRSFGRWKKFFGR